MGVELLVRAMRLVGNGRRTGDMCRLLLLPLLLLPLLPQGDGRYLISNSKDQTIKLWDTR